MSLIETGRSQNGKTEHEVWHYETLPGQEHVGQGAIFVKVQPDFHLIETRDPLNPSSSKIVVFAVRNEEPTTVDMRKNGNGIIFSVHRILERLYPFGLKGENHGNGKVPKADEGMIIAG